MDLQSILGYSQGSPFAGNPYLDIHTPEGYIDMSNTNIDLIGIDNKGNKKKMKAGRKNPYKFEGDIVREIPMQTGGIPFNPANYTQGQDNLHQLPLFDAKMIGQMKTPEYQQQVTQIRSSQTANTKAMVDKELSRRKALIDNSNKNNTFASSALGEKGRLFPNDVTGLGNVFDEYINPLTMIGNMADNIGHSKSPGELVQNATVPLAFGFLDGIIPKAKPTITSSQEVLSRSSGMDAVNAKTPGYNSHLFQKQGYVPPTTDPNLRPYISEETINNGFVTSNPGLTNITSANPQSTPTTQFLHNKKQITLSDFESDVNEQLRMGMGIKKLPGDLSVRFKSGNTNYDMVEPKFTMDIFNNGKNTGYVGLGKENSTVHGIDGINGTIFSKVNDYPYAWMKDKESDYLGSGFSGEVNKAIGNSLQKNGLGNLYSSLSHTNEGFRRWNNLINKGFASDITNPKIFERLNSTNEQMMNNGLSMDEIGPTGYRFKLHQMGGNIYKKGGLTEAQYNTQRGLNTDNDGDFNNITPNQARQILHDKKVNGHSLTPEQYKLFGYLSKGNTLKFQEGGNIYAKKGLSLEQMFNYIFDDKEEDVKGAPTAPTTEDVKSEYDKAQEEFMAHGQQNEQNYNSALDMVMNSGDYQSPNRQLYLYGEQPSGFQQFGSYQEGRQALEHQLELYQTGKTKNPVGPQSSILHAMSVYAPAGDGNNNPYAYASTISKHLGVPITTPISQIDKKRWADVIEKVEGNKKGNNPGNLRIYKK